jgi:Na+/H+-dicarboxylate symporter
VPEIFLVRLVVADKIKEVKMKKVPLVAKIMIGFVLGTILGLLLSEFCSKETLARVLPYISPFGDVLVAMLKTVVYPIILFSLIMGAASMPLKNSGKVGASVLTWYFLTSVIATVFGVALAYLFNPSMPAAQDVAKNFIGTVEKFSTSSGSGSIGAFFVGLFQNPFAALASGQFLPIIVFALAFGLCARSLLDSSSAPDSVKKSVGTLVDCCNGAQKISFRLIDCVIHYFPIGVFALSTVNFAQNGVLLFGPYAKITLCVMVCVMAMIFLIYPIAIAIFCRENPYKILARLREPMLTAFVTRSSAATLPVSFKAADSLGVDRSVSSFSLPVGATVNMDGVCVHLPVFVILAANMFGHNLGVVDIATLCVSIVFASIGAGGIPGGSVFLLFMVLENMGLPSSQVSVIVALCLGINPILDMFETCCNVTGDSVCTYIVSKKSSLR